MKCPYCYRSLDNTKQKDVFFCKRCNCYIMLEDVIESVENRQRSDKEYASWEREEHSKHISFIRKLIVAACVLAVVFGVGAVTFLHSNMEEKKLQHTVAVVLQDLKKGDYPTARSNANSLYYTGDSEEIRKKWDATRKQLLKDIDKAEKEEKGPGFVRWFKRDSDEPESAPDPDPEPKPGLIVRGFTNIP